MHQDCVFAATFTPFNKDCALVAKTVTPLANPSKTFAIFEKVKKNRNSPTQPYHDFSDPAQKTVTPLLSSSPFKQTLHHNTYLVKSPLLSAVCLVKVLLDVGGCVSCVSCLHLIGFVVFCAVLDIAHSLAFRVLHALI